MATVRIFLPTYRRTRLLQRAMASLQAQTFSDWICEVHNDAPDDDAPAATVARLGDARFSYHRHARNLGGTATFNLFFRATPEPFYAMLEDDNGWEPAFLEKMLAVAARHPDVTVFWSNQSVWQENADGEVRPTGRTVHLFEPSDAPRRIAWGQPAQILGALHSHGSALFRSRPGDDFSTPAVPIALVEAFRERRFPYPLVFVPEPLAQFTITRATARSQDRAEWAVLQTMLAATYLKHASPAATERVALWQRAREQQPPATGTLFLAAFAEPACRAGLRHARVADWIRWMRGAVRHPRVLPRVLGSRRRHADWWQFLDRATAEQFARSRHAAIPPK
ncbi:MAG TPA: glycosyltransferase [Opitutaceae bacterium]|nr:glycosyltransferase [Opitutaceae bacterium]